METGTNKAEGTHLVIQTLGGFQIWRGDVEISPSAWEREKALHLFQFLLTFRKRRLHKEEIIDRLWPELDLEKGNRDFKVALNAINKVLEPNRLPRAETIFIQRFDLAYGLNIRRIQLDVDRFETYLHRANQFMQTDVDQAIREYQLAVEQYKGEYLPERRYEDWTSAERERVQSIALSAMTFLAELLLERNPLDSLQLTQRVIQMEPFWEDAYRIQIMAYIATGNRPMAIRTYESCARLLEKEFGIQPLPETQKIINRIQQSS